MKSVEGYFNIECRRQNEIYVKCIQLYVSANPYMTGHLIFAKLAAGLFSVCVVPSCLVCWVAVLSLCNIGYFVMEK